MSEFNLTNQALLKKAQSGDKVALDKLTTDNLGLVGRIVGKSVKSGACINSGLTRDDLHQEGVIGLMHAIDLWDPEQGALSTYADFWIRQAIQRATQNTGREIRWPVHMQQKLARIQSARRAFDREGIHDPTVDQIAERTEMTASEVRDVLAMPSGGVSLEATRSAQSDIKISDVTPDDRVDVESEASNVVDDETTLALLDEAVNDICRDSTLADPERMKTVLIGRLGVHDEQRTLQSLAEEFNVTRARIGQIETEGRNRLMEHSAIRDLINDRFPSLNVLEELTTEEMMTEITQAQMTVDQLLIELREEEASADQRIEALEQKIAQINESAEDLRVTIAVLAERI